MAKLWDAKDSMLIAQTINDLAPNNAAARADLIVDAAWRAGVNFLELANAATRAIDVGLQPMSASELTDLIAGKD